MKKKNKRLYKIRLACGHIRSAFSRSGDGFYCAQCDTFQSGEAIR